MKTPEGFPKVMEEGGITAKIYQSRVRNKYNLFTLAFYMDGQFNKENFGSLDDAIARGKKVVRQLKGGEFEGVVMTSQQVKSFFASLKNLEGTGLSLEAGTQEIAACYGVLRGKVPPLVACKDYARQNDETVVPRTVEQVVTEFLAAKEAGSATRIKGKGKTVSERYLYDLRKKLEKVSAHFNGLLITLVTAAEINRFVSELRGVRGRPTKKGKAAAVPKPISGRTKNNYLQVINVLLEYARKQKYVPRHFAVMDEVDQSEESDFDIEIFTAEEITKILAAVRKDALPALAIGAFAGIRTAEVCRLDWSEVNLDKGLIEVKKGKAKTRSRRLVPITENLALFLKDVPDKDRNGPVWPNSEPFLFDLMRDAGKDSGVKWKHNALRHSFISYRVAKIKNVNEVAMEAGNSPDMIFKHYRELVTEKEADAWFGVTPEAVKAAKAKMERERAAKVVELPKVIAAFVKMLPRPSVVPAGERRSSRNQ
ncbi:MAG TPA: site-specific integrase [Candidatus Paceibacterota bacterium]|nr:site-specific integrase [Verrucomicrobiota bacterium]HSA10682.1 site-specific integrase [Candidatus Paceibacterota bacterium]